MGGTDMKFKHIAAVIFAGLLVMSSLGFSAAAAGEDAQIGDVNQDGVIDIDDATLVQRIVAGTDDKQQDIEELPLSDAYGSSIARISYEGNFGWETHSPSITKVTRSVLYPEQKDSYGMFISEYINPEYLFPNT